MVRVTLVYPSIGGRVRAAQMQPLSIAALAGLTPHDVALRFYDDRFENVDYDAPADLAGISVQTFTAKRTYEIAAEFRRRKVPVVLGGFHVTAVPEEAAQHADAVVIGQAEDLWPRLLEDARSGRLQRVYRQEVRPSLQGLRYPREIFQGKRYLPINMVEFGRGCPYTCGFCSVSEYFGRRKDCRPIGEVVDEIEKNAERIETLTGRKPQFYRDATTFSDEVCPQIANDLGEKMVSYPVLGDAGATYNAAQIKNVLEKAPAGSIVIAHMNHPEKQTAEGMMAVLPELQKEGFRFVKLEDYQLK